MKRMLLVLLLSGLAVSGLAQKSQSLVTDLQAVVETERAFARTATEKGVRDSFLAFIAEDGILYRPGPIKGKEWLAARPARPGLLTWQPTYADISAAGDMGITTGPWEFRPKGPEDEPVGYGQFATVWRKQPDGTWKFAIDIGIEHQKPGDAPIAWTLPPNFNRSKTEAKVDVAAAQAALLAVEQRFSKASEKKGLAYALADYAALDIRWLRNGSLPTVGLKEATAFQALKTGARPVIFQPVRAEVANSGDMGFTYGGYEMKGEGKGQETELGSYMRIWKKQANGRWKIVLDILNEHPKPAAS